MQACQAALTIEPQWYDAAKQLVRALLAAKRFDEAAVKARELLQQNQQDGEMHQVRKATERAASLVGSAWADCAGSH